MTGDVSSTRPCERWFPTMLSGTPSFFRNLQDEEERRPDPAAVSLSITSHLPLKWDS
jgi:hypothetical protein